MRAPDARKERRAASYNVAARRLREAYSSGAIAPLRDVLEPDNLEGAYTIQDINTGFWCAAGRRVSRVP